MFRLNRQLLGSAINNVHEDCPDEQLIIGAKSADLAEKMAEELAARVEHLVRMLCHQVWCAQVAPDSSAFGLVSMKEIKCSINKRLNNRDLSVNKNCCKFTCQRCLPGYLPLQEINTVFPC